MNQRLILWSLGMSAKSCFAGVLIVFLVAVAFDGESAQPRRQEVQREPRPERNAPALRENKQDLAALEARALDAEKNGNWQQAALFYRQASVAARQTGQLQKSVTNGEKALQFSEQARNPTLQIMAVLNLVSVYNPLQQTAKAVDLLVRAEEIVKQIAEPIRRQNFEAAVHRELGFLYLRGGKLKEAEAILDKVYQSLDKATKAGVIKANKASRLKSHSILSLAKKK